VVAELRIVITAPPEHEHPRFQKLNLVIMIDPKASIHRVALIG